MYPTGANRPARWAVPAVFLILAACGTPPAKSPDPAEQAAPVVTTAPLAPTLDASPPETVSPPEQSAGPQEASASPKAIPVNDDPRQLLKLSGMRVAALLGPANFVRRDGPAEIWQYRAAQCVLDVFLYRDGSRLAVAHVELRKRTASTEPPRRCFAGLLASAQ
jgi:hypothetical protein